MDINDWIRYAVLGLGAVIVPVLAANVGTNVLLNNVLMNYTIYSISVKNVVLAGAGILIADQLMKA